MFGRVAQQRSVIVTLAVAVCCLLLILAAQTFHQEWLKIQLDMIVAEVGSLLLVVGILHWLFDYGLRKEMLREISGAVTGSTRLHNSGLDNCLTNSRLVDDTAHWTQCANLTIGHQYSTRFFKDFYEVLKERCKNERRTTITVVNSKGTAAQFLQASIDGKPAVNDSIAEIIQLLKDIDGGSEKYTDLVFHDSVLRYSFIKSDEFVWIKFFTNSPGRAIVPAFKIRSGTPLFEFFSNDITRLLDASRENK